MKIVLAERAIFARIHFLVCTALFLKSFSGRKACRCNQWVPRELF